MHSQAVKPVNDIYTVTYITMDQDAEANPLGWHACVALSQLNKETKLMEVEAVWSFYGVPSTSRNGCLSRTKIKIGLDVDFDGNHGYIRREPLRFLEFGVGLHGKVFGLSYEKYIELKNRYDKAFEDQNTAILEIAARNKLKKSEQFRIYPYEKHSRLIYTIELINARDEKRPSRLHAFGVHISLTKWGPSINKSKNCKAVSLGFLVGILTDEQINGLTNNGSQPVLPRFSGKLGYLTFFSHGPMRVHTKKSGQKVYYHDHEDNDVTTYMIPPQEVDASDETRKALQMPEKELNRAIKMISQLQQLERLFINEELKSEYFPAREKLVEQISEQYEAFAIIESDRSTSSMIKFIKDAEELINTLYTIIVDLDPQEKLSATEFEEVEALASCLSLESKKKLCGIVGRAYLQPFEHRDYTLSQLSQWLLSFNFIGQLRNHYVGLAQVDSEPPPKLKLK